MLQFLLSTAGDHYMSQKKKHILAVSSYTLGIFGIKCIVISKQTNYAFKMFTAFTLATTIPSATNIRECMLLELLVVVTNNLISLTTFGSAVNSSNLVKSASTRYVI